jgi:gluconate 2-dehydrogenase gamma chain
MNEQAKHGLSRRDFLKNAGLIVGGAAVSSVAFLNACNSSNTTTAATTSTGASDIFLFFSPPETATIKAAFGRLFPGSAADPGAIEAKAYIYLDRALMGAYAGLQETYRNGLAAMDAYSQGQFKANFVNLTATQMDSVLTDMQSGKAAGFTFPAAAAFFGLLMKHVGEGMFCDPVYGGNYNLVGWKLLGYPGSQTGYTNAQMTIGFDQATVPIKTLADVEAEVMPQPTSGF